jgi:hypothetical protein
MIQIQASRTYGDVGTAVFSTITANRFGKYIESMDYISTTFTSTGNLALVSSIYDTISSAVSTNNSKYIGLIAQEVQEVFPSATKQNATGLGFNPETFTFMLITATQSLHSTVKGHETTLSALPNFQYGLTETTQDSDSKNTVTVSFNKPYMTTPSVTVTPLGSADFLSFKLTSVTTTGFTLESTVPSQFNYNAIGV